MNSNFQQEFDFEEKEETPLENLVLKSPLVFFDLETTGLDIQNDRIVQFAFAKINVDKSRNEWMELVNPGMPIPSEASRVNKITDEMVQDKRLFDYFAPKIWNFLSGCDLSGYNIVRFDLPFLQAEMTRCGHPLDLDTLHVIDPQVIFHKNEPRDLAAAYRIYCAKNLKNAHDALADIRATIEILDSQLKQYGNIPKDVEGLHKYCNPLDTRWVTKDRKFYWKNGEALIYFGKYRGKNLQWLYTNEKDYLLWIKDGDFSEETKALVKDAINGIFPKKQEPETY